MSDTELPEVTREILERAEHAGRVAARDAYENGTPIAEIADRISVFEMDYMAQQDILRGITSIKYQPNTDDADTILSAFDDGLFDEVADMQDTLNETEN